MKVTIISIVIGAFGTVTTKETGGLGSWRTSGHHCWERPEYWEESWRLEESCCHSNISERPSVNANVKNSKGVIIIIKLKKLWNRKAPVIPIVNGLLGTISKGLKKRLKKFEIGGRTETIQTIALLRSAKILRSVLNPWLVWFLCLMAFKLCLLFKVILLNEQWYYFTLGG